MRLKHKRLSLGRVSSFFPAPPGRQRQIGRNKAQRGGDRDGQHETGEMRPDKKDKGFRFLSGKPLIYELCMIQMTLNCVEKRQTRRRF